VSNSATLPGADEEATNKVRALATALVASGTAPADVTRVLAYVATELGLRLSDGPVPVLIVTLRAVVAALTTYERAKASATDAAPSSRTSGALH
jgi:hypothetical protein